RKQVDSALTQSFRCASLTFQTNRIKRLHPAACASVGNHRFCCSADRLSNQHLCQRPPLPACGRHVYIYAPADDVRVFLSDHFTQAQGSCLLWTQVLSSRYFLCFIGYDIELDLIRKSL